MPTGCAPYNITASFLLCLERQLELWFPRNDSHRTMFLGFDCLKVLTLTGQCFYTFYCLKVLTFAGQYFKVLTDAGLFCQWNSVLTQRTSILTSSSSDALIIQTGRCTRQICWWTVISTNLWKIFSRNSKDLNLDVSRTSRTRWLTGHFRWTRQISWWIYSSHALFNRFSVLIIRAFFSKVRGYPFKSAPPTIRECNIMSYCTNINTIAFSSYFKTQLELWFPRTYNHQTCF